MTETKLETQGCWGLVLVMAAAITWGTTGTSMVLIGLRSPLGPLAVGFLRVLVAAPILLALAALTGAFGGRAGLRPHLLHLAVAGGAQAAYQVGYFNAVPRIGVAATALIAICTSPLLIAALAAWFLYERLTARVAMAMAAGIVGTALLVGGRFTLPGARPRSAMIGAALALGATLAYALYVVVTKILVHHLPPLAISGVSFGLAAIFLFPAARSEPDLWGAVRPVWIHAAYLGIVPTALAYAVYVAGLRRTSATVAGIGTLVELLTATLLELVLFGESLGAAGLLGSTLLLAAVTVPVLGNARHP